MSMIMSIQSQPALIGINVMRGQLQMSQRPADVEYHTEHAKVELQTTLPKVQISQYQCFAEANLKNNADFRQANVSYAVSEMYASIGKVVDQGNQLSDPRNKDAIADQGEYNAYGQFIGDYNIGFIPKSRPDIQLKRGTIDLNVTGGKVNFNVRLNKPQIDYTHEKVEIYLRQMADLKIQWTPSQVDMKV